MFGYNLQIEHTPLIREVVKLTGCNTYLELGISTGENIHAMTPFCNNCIGVDIIDIRKHRDFLFYQMSTTEFFKQYKGGADIIFIDANHGFEAVKIDFINSLSILNEFGVIFIHDTDPIKEHYLKPELCNDSYKIIDWLMAMTLGHINILTLPVSVAGLTMVTRANDRRVYKI